MKEYEDPDFIDEQEEEEEEEQSGLYEHFSFGVDKGQGMLRIDKWLTNRMEKVSRNRIQSAADAGNILVDRKSVV